MTKNVILRSACAIAAFTLTTVSFAEVAQAKTIEFTYSQADVSSTKGLVELDERIKRFARSSCRDTGKFTTAGQRRTCRAHIVEQLRSKIFQPGQGTPVR